MKLEQLVNRLGNWLEADGPYSGLVLSSRIRLARNIKDILFPNRATESAYDELINIVLNSVKEIDTLKNINYFQFDLLDKLDKQFLMERHLISSDFVHATNKRGLLFDDDENISIMINEEDHLRLQSLRPGLQLKEAYKTLSQIDDQFSEKLSYAFSSKFGYLTACPTNVGTGMRASILIHLPGLSISKQIDKVLKSIAQLGLSVRGMYGEGSKFMGNFYQISNQVTLGHSENDIVDNIETISRRLIEHELNSRTTLYKDARAHIEDQVWRAYGIITNARLINSSEVLELLSAIRLGVEMRLIKDIDISTINNLLIKTQPAYLQKIIGKSLTNGERDIYRAQLIRETLTG